jgi:hypothetical protein
MKKIILLLFVLLSFKTKAQELNDRIYKKDGDSIICKITKIQPHWISYDHKGENGIVNDHIHIDDVRSYTNNNVSNKIEEKNLAEIAKNKDTEYAAEFIEPKTILRLSVLAPGFVVEQKITNKLTLVLNLWTGFAVVGSSEGPTNFYFQPNIAFEPRFYPNLEKRKSKGKRTDCFSGMYIGIPVTIGFPDARFSAGPVTGFQKTLRKRGYWNIGIGLGINSYQSETKFGLVGEFGLGFILNFKKKNSKSNIE